jgi:GTPase-activating protein BEM2
MDIDFLQVKEAFTAVDHAINRWITFKKEAVGERQSPDSFFSKRNRALQACFEELHSSFADGFPYTADQLFEASIQAELPPQGAYIEHHYAKRISVTSGSYVPLMLTDVLPSYKLFEQTDLLEALATVEKRAPYGSQAMNRQHRERPAPSNTSAWAGRGNKPSPLRRTNSYPPARTSLATTGNPDLDHSTHNRIAGLTSRHFPMLKTLRDIAGVEQSLLHVQDGELVLKVVTDMKRLSRPGSMIIETSSKRASLASKRSSAQVFGTPALSTPPPGKLNSSARNSFHPENGSVNIIDVVTKAGSLDRLVDVLVLGIEDFSVYLLEDNMESTGKKPTRLQMNMDEIRTTFLATFRSFCSPMVLLEYLRKRFMGAVYVAAHINDEDPEDFSELFPDWTPIEPLDNDKVDWQLVGKIQCGVLDTISVWISQYFSDFHNTPTLGVDFIRFLGIVQQELLAWEDVCKTKPYATYFSNQISSMARGIKKTFAATFYKPAQYSSSFQTPATTILMPVISLMGQRRVDQFNVLFNELDESLLLLYQQVSIEDWMSAFELFEIQSTDICGFYNPKGSAPVREEETRLRTIFTVISQIQRPRSGGSLLNVLPKSIRQLHRLHENLVAWIVTQISDNSINFQERAGRIQSLVAFLRSSRQRMSYLDFYATDQTVVRLTEERAENRLGVPSFIASAVATALVSPESRVFTRAWARVFEEDDQSDYVKSQGYDNLAEFVHRKSTGSETGVSRTLTPCLGWIMERMLEIACYVPNMSLESTRLINFDKRRYIFNLISNIVPASDDLDFMEPFDQPLPLQSFALQLISSDLLTRRLDLKAIREVASIEWGHSEHKPPRLFRSLIADEQRKNRRDQRRRAEIEKQIRDHQKARPLAIREAPSQPDLREAARSGRDAKSARGARGMFLRTIRPLSIAISSNPFGEKPEPRIVKVEELPRTISIPPGTRASQKLPLHGALILTRIAYEKEHVFTVRTEEGHECWLQGVDARDTLGWVQLLSAVAGVPTQRGNNRSRDTPLHVRPVKAADPGNLHLGLIIDGSIRS